MSDKDSESVMIARAKLIEYIEPTIRRAPEGESFVLASGKKSSYYIDLREAVLTNGSAMEAAADLLYDRLPREVDSIGGVPTAGLMLMGALLMRCNQSGSANQRVGFYTREKPKLHGMSRQIEGTPLGVACLIEDTVTTGMSLIQHTEIARAHGGNVKHAIALFDREEGGREALEAIGVTLHACFRRRDFGL
jgi:orotate phosphoribosyltransferase